MCLETDLNHILRILVGIGQQVAQHFCNGFLVHVGIKILVRIDHGETDSFLVKSRGEAFAHAFHQLSYGLRGEAHPHLLLFHFPEVEQLVHQIEQALAVAVDDFQFLPLVGRDVGGLHHFFQRTDDERYRRTDFVGNHGEEVDFCLVYFFFLLAVQLVDGFGMFLFAPAHHVAQQQSDGEDKQQEVANLERQGKVEGRMYDDTDGGTFFVPYIVIVRGFDPEDISTCR